MEGSISFGLVNIPIRQSQGHKALDEGARQEGHEPRGIIIFDLR